MGNVESFWEMCAVVSNHHGNTALYLINDIMKTDTNMFCFSFGLKPIGFAQDVKAIGESRKNKKRCYDTYKIVCHGYISV